MKEINQKVFIEEFNHFCKCINFKQSALDCRAIQFMNEMGKYLDETHEKCK